MMGRQKGVALDIGIDEGTLKAKKLKKFEEFKQKKLQEEELRQQRQRDKSPQPPQKKLEQQAQLKPGAKKTG